LQKICLRLWKDVWNKLRKGLFDGTVPSNKKLYDSTPKSEIEGRDVGGKGEGGDRKECPVIYIFKFHFKILV
jgi:hypothetical protein